MGWAVWAALGAGIHFQILSQTRGGKKKGEKLNPSQTIRTRAACPVLPGSSTKLGQMVPEAPIRVPKRGYGPYPLTSGPLDLTSPHGCHSSGKQQQPLRETLLTPRQSCQASSTLQVTP